ncbi:hypothetical protein M9Y10_022761 [Tritrichomonas musculus]|uniref:TFIID subunit TAF5 NTD2 domain-containing protein n=1 Tax=Tritrichomonas musculus TaxID=1915356 RepID=A0ABR2KTI5_9EUKA
MKTSNSQGGFKNEIVNYLESCGYSIANPETLRNASIPPANENCSVIDYMIRASASNESVLNMPKMYEDLVEFVNQVPNIQYLQLKPLLFAFFYRTVIELHREKHTEAATEFFEKYTKDNPDGTRPFHCFHDSDLKKLQQYLMASSFTQTNSLDKTAFSTQLTETTYQALVAFLMDKSYDKFLLILNNYINVTHVPLDHFTSGIDKIPGFIYKSTEQVEQPSLTLTTLLKDNPYDMAKRFLGPECKFEFFDDDPTRITNPFQLPPIIHERVIAISLDIQNMAHLSKSDLPSCAYFTFNDENLAYDINGSGSLIAAATERNYIKLFSTNVHTDLDDELKFQQLNYPKEFKKHLLVPRYPVGRDQTFHYCMRTLIGPRTYCLKFSPESRFLLAGCNNNIRLYSCETSGIAGSYDVPCGIIWSCDWSPLGYHFVTASDDSCAWMWAVDRSKPLRLFVHHQEPLTDIKYHPNAATIATSSYDRSIMLWDIRCQGNSNPFTKMFAESVAVPNVVQFTRNGRIVISGDESGKISIWDIGEGRMIGSVRAHKDSVVDMAVSIEGTILASTAAGSEVLLWDMGTLCSTASASGAEPLKKFQPRKAQTHRIAFSNRNLLHAIGSIRCDNEEQFLPNHNKNVNNFGSNLINDNDAITEGRE